MKIESIEESIPVFGVDIYSKTKEEALAVSSFFNFPKTKEVCVIIEREGGEDYEYNLN